MLAISLILLEIGLWMLASYGALQGLGLGLQAPIKMKSSDLRVYKHQFDETLGWPTESYKTKYLDRESKRPSPFESTTSKVCGAIFGDSFAYSAEVEDKDAWPEVLSREKGCLFKNYGVGGYGTDQAYLRFRGMLASFEPGQVIILSFIDMDLRRNLQQNRSLLNWNFNIYETKPVIDFTSIYHSDGASFVTPAVVVKRIERLFNQNSMSDSSSDQIVTLDTNLIFRDEYNLYPHPYQKRDLSFPLVFAVMGQVVNGIETRYFESKYAYGRLYRYIVEIGLEQILERLFYNDFENWLRIKEHVHIKILNSFLSDCKASALTCFILRIPSNLGEVADPHFPLDTFGVTSNNIRSKLIEPQTFIDQALLNSCMRITFSEIGVGPHEITLQMGRESGGHYNENGYLSLGRCIGKLLETSLSR